MGKRKYEKPLTLNGQLNYKLHLDAIYRLLQDVVTGDGIILARSTHISAFSERACQTFPVLFDLQQVYPEWVFDVYVLVEQQWHEQVIDSFCIVKAAWDLGFLQPQGVAPDWVDDLLGDTERQPYVLALNLPDGEKHLNLAFIRERDCIEVPGYGWMRREVYRLGLYKQERK